MKICDIVVGARCRRELGDIAGLARSIAEVGLLHPVVVRPDGLLIAGARRLAACKLLGWDKIPVTEADLEEIVRGEIAENAQRKNLLPSEIDAVRRMVEPLERAAAAERRVLAHASPGNFPEQEKGQTRDKVGAFAGVSGKQVEKIARVVDAAEQEPELYGYLVAEMDAGGKVDGIYRRLQIIKQAGAVRREPPPLPGNGPYRVIVADC